jgi:hypothetical protein
MCRKSIFPPSWDTVRPLYVFADGGKMLNDAGFSFGSYTIALIDVEGS